MLSVSIISMVGGPGMLAIVAGGVLGGVLGACARMVAEAANAREIAASAGIRNRFMRTHLQRGSNC